MPRPGAELRRAMSALLEEGVALRETPPPGYPGLRQLYGSNAAIADAAGFPTAGEAIRAHRERYPHARRSTFAKIAVSARRERQGFLRNLQRYADTTRRPRGLVPFLDRLRREGMARYRAEGGEFRDAADLAELARVLASRGVTMPAGWLVTLVVSDDEREREPPGVMFYPPPGFVGAVAEGKWDEAAEFFFDGWGRAYGVGQGVIATEVDELELVAGLHKPPARYGP